jgi:two-component system sensor histidine kinase TctE
MSNKATKGQTLSLTMRLTVGLGGLLLFGGIVLTLAAFTYGRVAARDAFDRLLVGAANTIASNISISDGQLVVDLPRSAFDLLALAPNDRIAYEVRGVNGELVTGYALDMIPDRPMTFSDMPHYFDADFFGEPARFVRTTRTFSERQFSGTVQVVVGQTILARQELAFDITKRALLGLLIGGIAVLGMALVVVRSALRPLEKIADTIRQRDPRDLTQIDQHAPKEISDMVSSLNAFMQRLEQQFDVMRNLISDTAHQLRTPVAALRAQSDFALRESDEIKRAQIVSKIHSRSLSLGRLLDQMLSRAMVIHRIESARLETLDLRDIALTLIDDWDHSLIYPDHDIHLEIGPEPIFVYGDLISLTEAAKNLLSNALAHGVAPVTIGVESTNSHACIWVRDLGGGPQVELDIGDRFVRSSVSKGKSAGLGLSIAKSVADAFEGRLELVRNEAGFKISILLPLKRGNDV